MAPTTGDPALVTGRFARRLGSLLRTRDLGPRATAVTLAVTTRVVLANAIAGALVAFFLTISEHVPAGEWPLTKTGSTSRSTGCRWSS